MVAARERNKTYGKLAHLGVVDAEDLRVFGRAQTGPRREVHGPEDDGRHHKAPREARRAVRQLDRQLHPMVIYTKELTSAQTS